MGHGNLDSHKSVTAIEYSEMRATLLGWSEIKMRSGLANGNWQIEGSVFLTYPRP